MGDFKHVAVFMGGWSAEREVSLNSGTAVYNALCRQGINATAVDVDHKICEKLQNNNFSHVFNMLHGRGGEDGVIQGFLDVMKWLYQHQIL